MALLLDFGANVNHADADADADGWTALHQALDFAIDSSIQAGLSPRDKPLDGISGLIQHGANLNLRTVEGESPLDVAR